MSVAGLIKKMPWRHAVVIIVAIGFGIFIGARFFPARAPTAIYRDEGVLTSSLLGFEVNTRGEFSELNGIEDSLRDLIAERLREGQIKTMSIYFRLLNSGRWFAINPDEQYSPASLLKIPIMMAYYKQAEERPAILQMRIYNDGEYADTEQTTVPPERRLEKGVSYTIEDLVGRMVQDSNNEAMHLLEENLPQNFIADIYKDLKIENPYTATGDFMTVTDYPFFLRVLYNTTYLNNKYSEKGLDLLTKSSFTEGLPAKLPPHVLVAHKFGFRLASQYAELHDCGIVYYPKHPYLLCVMTKGYERDALISVIQDASLLTYQGVDEFF